MTSGVEMLKKVKFSVFTLWRRIGEVEVQLQSFLTTALGYGECLASLPDRFTSGIAPQIRSGHFEGKVILTLLGFEPRAIQTIT
jgi:hypothetical protein